MNLPLTVILPLKDRGEFTPRFLRGAEEAGVRVSIADGSAKPMTWNTPAPSYLNFDYFYAGHDDSIGRWWHKMVMAFDRVETPYVMVADNDDILVGRGLQRCCDFLDTNPDYIAASGRIQGFWCYPNQVHGPHHRLSKRYAMYDVPANYCGTDVNLRVLAGFTNSWSYYAVYRTEALKTIWNEVHDLDLSDLQIHEKFCAMRALSLGKIVCFDDCTSYLRQYGTSQIAVRNARFAENLMRTNITQDRDAVFKRMGHLGVDVEALRMLWAQWWEGYLYRAYGPWPTLRRALRGRFPRIAGIVQNRHRYLPLNWGYR